MLLELKLGVAIATAIPMDGFHYTREDLDKMQDPKEAHERRGAPFTFDVHGIKKLVNRLREPVVTLGQKKAELIYAPSFEHVVKVCNDGLSFSSPKLWFVSFC